MLADPLAGGLRAGEDGRPRQDSNLRTRLRRAVLYPLSYGGAKRNSTAPDSLVRPPLVAGGPPFYGDAVSDGSTARAAARDGACHPRTPCHP